MYVCMYVCMYIYIYIFHRFHVVSSTSKPTFEVIAHDIDSDFSVHCLAHRNRFRSLSLIVSKPISSFIVSASEAPPALFFARGVNIKI